MKFWLLWVDVFFLFFWKKKFIVDCILIVKSNRQIFSIKNEFILIRFFSKPVFTIYICYFNRISFVNSNKLILYAFFKEILNWLLAKFFTRSKNMMSVIYESNFTIWNNCINLFDKCNIRTIRYLKVQVPKL